MSTSLNLDSLISRLRGISGAEVRTSRTVQMTETELRELCLISSNLFMSQPSVLQLYPPLRVVGDIHGQFSDLIRIFDQVGWPPAQAFLFLGDYVDRGKQSIETIALLLAFKLKYPDSFFLLRGNHECSSISRVYGFFDECKRKFNTKLWKTFIDCFNCLPFVALIGDKIFCCHGGLSPDLHSIDQVRKITRPTDIPDQGLLCDLVWSDPDEGIVGWGESERGVSYTFGPEVVTRFVQRHGFEFVCRAHQVVENGYEFFAKRHLVTLFSAPNYCGEFDNDGAVMTVDLNFTCAFRVIKRVNNSSSSTRRPVTPIDTRSRFVD